MTRVLLISGTGFTGSTLLSFLLNGHPQIASVGEVTGPFAHWPEPPTYPCSCGETLADCSFWQRVGKEMAARGLRFDPEHWQTRFELGTTRLARQLLTRSLRHNRADQIRDAFVMGTPGWGRTMREIAQRNHALAESILAVTGKKVLADASKDPTRARYLERLTELDAYMLHLVRDSLGFVSSQIANRKQHAPAEANLGAGVRAWNRMAGHVERLFALVPPERRLRVRYEDLCRDPQHELGRIAEFVDLEPQSGPVDFRAQEHHIIGNRMRLATSSEVVLDEKWRDRLSPAQIDEIRRRTSKHRRAFGYE